MPDQETPSDVADHDNGADHAVTGRDKSRESTPTSSGHSTADDQARRNQEDESPG